MTFEEFLAERFAIWRETAPRLMDRYQTTLANPRLPRRVLNAAEREYGLEELRLNIAHGRAALPPHWHIALASEYQRRFGGAVATQVEK